MSVHDEFIKKCYQEAVNAGKDGFEPFFAMLVSGGKVLASSKNTTDYDEDRFGHSIYNVVSACMGKYSDEKLSSAVLYCSTAPCARCAAAIASLGVTNIVYGVSYEKYAKILPFWTKAPDVEGLYKACGMKAKLTGPVMEDEGMRVYENWCGEEIPLDVLLSDAEQMRNTSEMV